MNFYQIFLPIAALIYFVAVFVVRSWVLWKQTGVNPFVFGKGDTAHDYIGRVLNFITLATWVSIIFYSFYPESYHLLFPFSYLESDSIKMAGVMLLVLSILWISVAEYQMAASWRIGIDYNETTELVSKGLFKISRNPVFLGVFISYIGMFLIMPNALSFAIMLLMVVSIQIQVRLEEAYLESVHEETYLKYKKKVRRWI